MNKCLIFHINISVIFFFVCVLDTNLHHLNISVQIKSRTRLEVYQSRINPNYYFPLLTRIRLELYCQMKYGSEMTFFEIGNSLFLMLVSNTFLTKR